MRNGLKYQSLGSATSLIMTTFRRSFAPERACGCDHGTFRVGNCPFYQLADGIDIILHPDGLLYGSPAKLRCQMRFQGNSQSNFPSFATFELQRTLAFHVMRVHVAR
jgi:hypothetical protein